MNVSTGIDPCKCDIKLLAAERGASPTAAAADIFTHMCEFMRHGADGLHMVYGVSVTYTDCAEQLSRRPFEYMNTHPCVLSLEL